MILYLQDYWRNNNKVSHWHLSQQSQQFCYSKVIRIILTLLNQGTDCRVDPMPTKIIQILPQLSLGL